VLADETGVLADETGVLADETGVLVCKMKSQLQENLI
jgi:hypothetical protein